MYISNKICNQIPVLDKMQLKKIGESGVQLTCFNGPSIVATTLIQNEALEVESIVVPQKCIVMIKLLGASEGVELKVGKTLSVKSKLGKYQGLLLSEPGISLSYDGDNEKTLVITQEDIIKAAKFVDKKKKTPVLSGINISSTHICATDKFIATLKGQFSPENITISNELVEILKQIQFSQINYSAS